MKKKNIIDLIKYHVEKNEFQFNNAAIEIAHIFEQDGDYQLAEYIMALISGTNTFIPQNNEFDGPFIKPMKYDVVNLPLPTAITDDIKGIINAVKHNVGINKFLFEGAPGTGKTESVKVVSKLLQRNLYIVDFSALIDSKMGQSAKNIVNVFEQINNLTNPNEVVILFDEIDALALDRINNNDLREMGRVTSVLLKELDNLNSEIVLIATTNLYSMFDKALIRRFDSVINFNRYSDEDLEEVAVSILETQLKIFKNAGRDMKIFRKLIRNFDPIPYPGELKNLIRSSLAFSDPDDNYDYLRRIKNSLLGERQDKELQVLRNMGFTYREIEVLTGVSKSHVARSTKERNNE